MSWPILLETTMNSICILYSNVYYITCATTSSFFPSQRFISFLLNWVSGFKSRYWQNSFTSECHSDLFCQHHRSDTRPMLTALTDNSGILKNVVCSSNTEVIPQPSQVNSLLQQLLGQVCCRSSVCVTYKHRTEQTNTQWHSTIQYPHSTAIYCLPATLAVLTCRTSLDVDWLDQEFLRRLHEQTLSVQEGTT